MLLIPNDNLAGVNAVATFVNAPRGEAISRAWRQPSGCGISPSISRSGRLTQPFAAGIETGDYWLTRLHSGDETRGMRALRDWRLAIVDCENAVFAASASAH